MVVKIKYQLVLLFLPKSIYTQTFNTMGLDHPAFTLSGLCAIGGIMGYARKGSFPSLVAGITFSALYGGAGYLLKQNADYGLELAFRYKYSIINCWISRSIPTGFAKPIPLVLLVLGGASTAYYAKNIMNFIHYSTNN